MIHQGLPSPHQYTRNSHHCCIALPIHKHEWAPSLLWCSAGLGHDRGRRGWEGNMGARNFQTSSSPYETHFVISRKICFWFLGLFSRDVFLIIASFLSFFLFVNHRPFLFLSSFTTSIFFSFSHHYMFGPSISPFVRFSFSSQRPYANCAPRESRPGKAFWGFGGGAKGTGCPGQHHLPKELNLKSEFSSATT